MAIPTIRTWANGEVVTDALLNEQIRDPANFLLGPVRARLKRALSQSIGNNAFTALAWDAEDDDTHGGHSTTVNNTRFTAPEAGWYIVTASIPWANNATGRREVSFRVNAGAIMGGQSAHVNATVNSTVSAARLIKLNVGDYVEVMVFQTSGGALNADIGVNDGPRFDLVWVAKL